MRRQCELPLDGREQRVSCAREGDEEGVALSVDLVTSVRDECRPQQPLVLREHLAVPRPLAA